MNVQIHFIGRLHDLIMFIVLKNDLSAKFNALDLIKECVICIVFDKLLSEKFSQYHQQI